MLAEFLGALLVTLCQIETTDAVTTAAATGLVFHQEAAAPAQDTTKAAKRKKSKPKPRKNTDSENPPASQPDEEDDTAPSDVPAGFVWDRHPSFRFQGGRVDFRLKLQEDFHRSYEGADIVAGLSMFEARRNRIGIEGNLFTHFEYEVERDLTDRELTAAELAEGMTPKSLWADVYVNVDYSKAAEAQGGQFKIPFGLDELTPITRNDFVYRSLSAVYLSPGRDIGAMVHGRVLKRRINYWAGVFQHDGDNARSKKIQGGNQTLAIRITTEPLRRSAVDLIGRLELGTAFTFSALGDDAFRPNGLRARTVMTEDTFFNAVYVKGRRTRWEGDLDWNLGRASIRSEFTYVTDDRLGQGLDNADLPDARYRSWYLSGTYILTGEKKKRPIVPDRAFLQGGIGTLELAGRYERLWCDSVGGQDLPLRNPRAETILASGDRVLTTGVNWILNRWVTLQINGIREEIEDVQRNPAPNGGAFWSHVLRVQLVL